MKRAACPALLALGLVCATVAATSRGAREIALFDGPKGAWLGALRADAPLVLLEERDGWRHVRLEGWIMDPDEPTPSGSGAATMPAPSGAEAPGQAVLQGVLAPLMGAGGSAGAGVLVLLVSDNDPLDAEHRKAGAECRARLEQKDSDIEALRAEANRALNSSDNFREAANRNDRLKSRLAVEGRERQDLIRQCRSRAQQIFEASVAQRALSDGNGRFEFPGVARGRYRVVAFETAGDAPRTWSFSFEVEGPGTRVLDPLADRSPMPADWGLR
jgi:hypothetical protein